MVTPVRALLMLGVSFGVLTGCSIAPSRDHEPVFSELEPSVIFPAERSLHRPEDGVALPGGSLLVADQFDGLRLIHPDGTSRPFGKFAEAGYRHEPPGIVGGPNGVTLEPAGTHVLVADVFRGGIYRVEIDSETTEHIYQHEFGVNTVRRDSRGGIWFTQSTRNRPDNGEEELFRSVGVPVADGAVFYLSPESTGDKPRAREVAGGFLFANGLALSEDERTLYVAETMGNGVYRFRIDPANGRAWDKELALTVDHPDNLEFTSDGQLWIACPLRNELVVFDPQTKDTRTAFRVETSDSKGVRELIEARLDAGESWLDLMSPALWEPAPGLITGMILPAGDGPAYATGLGDSLIRLP